MNTKENNQKIAMRIILLFGFIMAQGITWKIFAFLNQSAQWSEKTYLAFQIEGACIYTFLCIYFTRDKLLLDDFGNKFPIIPQMFNVLVFISTLFFVWFPKIVLLIPEIFSSQSIGNEVELIKKEAKEETNRYNNSSTYVRVLVGIGGLTIFIMIVSWFVSQNTIQIISDIMNTILNVVLFIIVCANVDTLIFDKDQNNISK